MTTVSEARGWLKDLTTWVPRMPATWSDLPLRASRMGDGVHVRLSRTPMPGGMERAIDTWADNGVLGIHTQIGVQQALGPWADELRTMRDMLIGPDPHTGTIPYLLAHLDWAAQHMDHTQWEFMCADIRGVHDRVQGIVWPEKEVIGMCPDIQCHGVVRANTSKHGITDTATCDGCGKDFHTDPDQYAHDVRAVGQRLTVNPLAVVTVAQIERLWAGEINADIVKKWVKRGKLTPRNTTPATYPLAKVNVLAHDLIERRRRRAEKTCKASA